MMRYRLVQVLVAISIILSTGAAAAAGPASVNIVADKGSAKTLQAEATVDAPVDAVWGELTNYGQIKSILPGYDRSTVLQSSATGATVDIGLKAQGLAPSFRYQVKVREDKAANTIHIQRISGDFKSINASYKLIPVENGTRTKVVYKLEIDLGSIPTLGANQLLKSNAQKVMVALQNHCPKVYSRIAAQK